MRSPLLHFLLLPVLLAGSFCQAERVRFFCAADQINLTSAGVALDKDFVFELGVFKSGFVPTAANATQWAANWKPAVGANGVPARDIYNPTTRRFDGEFTVTDNVAPFTVGTSAYVWGFRAGSGTPESILFRNTSWNWPAPNPLDPTGSDWDIAQATAVVGSIQSNGTPYLMKAAAPLNAALPPTNMQQWTEIELAGVLENGANDDPDHDGVSNALEFVMGTSPTKPGAPTVTPLNWATLGDQSYLQITIPRRADHQANLEVEVSSDLVNWHSGTGYTVEVSNAADALVVRDASPYGPEIAKRFMRLKVQP